MKKNPFWLSLRAILSLFFRGFVFFPPLLFLFLFSSDLYSAPPACDVNCFKPALDAAKAGSGAAENRMGTMFATGVGAPYAPQVAAAWYERAARQGHAGASINLGMLYLTGQGVAEDTQQAYQWIEKAAKLGSGEANHLLGMLYERGMGVAADVEEARRLYKKAGEQGSLLARTEWTRLSNNPWLDDAPLPVVTAQKTSLARHGTKRGVPVSNPSPQDSQQTLARDVSKPVVVAVPKVEPASVGNQRVSALLQKTRDAALVGDLEAQNHLGTMVLSGFGIEPRPKEAFHWFQSAADAGHPRAQINLASMMLTGMGTEEDPIEAARWLEQAAAQNHPEAQSLLASMYEKGKGVGKNEVKALQWYSLAAGQGQGDAVKARDRLMASMSPNDVAKAVGGMKSFLVQHNQKTVQPQEIQLASLKLDDASAAPMGGHTLRGIADVKPEPPLVSNREASSSAAQTDKRAKRGVAKQTQVASAAEAKPDSKSQPPAASDQWEIEVGDGNAGKNLAETKRARVAYVPLLSVPAVKKVDDQGQKGAEAELGQAIAAGEKKDLDAVRKHLTTAHEQDSLNPEVAKRLGILAMEGGKPDEALPYFKAAAQGAALKGMVPEATFANERIDEILSIAPPWVEEKLAAASAVKPDKTSAVSTWSGLLEQAMARAQEGDLPKAITLGQQALDLARKDLGDEHASTILTQREMGNIFVQNGQLDAAEPLFQQSAAQGEKVLGDTHPETLAAKALLAELRESRMQLDGAVAAYREISASYNKGFGPNNPSKLQTDLSLARVLKNQGNTAESDKVVRATCPQVAQVYGYYHAETAACLQQLAEILRAQGDSEAALKELQQALAINAGILPRQDPRVVGGQITLAGIQKDLGHFSDAKKNLLTVLDDIKADAGPLGFLQSDASTVLARVHMDMGEFDQAQSLTKALYEEHKAKLGSDHPNTLAALADLAGIKEKKGLFDEAEKSMKEALAGYGKIFGDKHPATVTVLNNMGQMMEAAGLYDDAEPVLRQAVALSEQVFGKNHPTTLTTQNNLALLHESQGNFDRAEPLYQQAIDTYTQILGPRHSDTIAVINNLAYLYLLKQEYAKALPLFEKILALWQETLGDAHQRTLKAMNNLARTNHKLGKLEVAEGLFKKALSQRTKVMGPRHMDTLRSMHDLASLYSDMGRQKEAEDLLKKTLSLDDQVLGKLHPYTFETVNTLAKVLEKKKDLEGAFQIRQEGFTRRTEFLNRMLWTAGDDAREGYVRLHRPELDGYLAMLTRLDAATAGREVLNIALKRKGILLKITSEIQQVSRMTQDPQLEAIGKDLSQTRKELASLTLAGPTPETVDTHLKSIQTLEDKVNALQLQLGQSSKRFRRSIIEVAVNQLIENLPKDGVLVDFLVFKDGDKDKLLAGLLIKDKDQARFDLVVYPDLEAIQKAVVNYRTVIQDEEADNDAIIDAGQGTYDLVWRPIVKLMGERQAVYLVPDGILNILPFPALVDEKEQYLTLGTDLHMLGSSRDLVPSDVPAATGQFLILAGPDYNFDQIVAANESGGEQQRKRSASLKVGLRAFSSGMRGLRFDPLPGAEKEGTLVSEISTTGKKKNRILTKNEAQEKVLSVLTEPPEVLHIATHGFFLKPDDNLRKRLLKLQRGADLHMVPPGDNPLLRSGLAFAGINSNAQLLGEIDTDNDGVLTALEVMGRDFSGTRLAVLSACETGLGEIHEGEGVYGLRRAFQEAGVQSVISSLWEVSDAGTQELMSNMYKRLSQGMDPHKALRESQLQMMTSKEFGFPYIWSAFMMMGR